MQRLNPGRNHRRMREVRTVQSAFWRSPQGERGEVRMGARSWAKPPAKEMPERPVCGRQGSLPFWGRNPLGIEGTNRYGLVLG